MNQTQTIRDKYTAPVCIFITIAALFIAYSAILQKLVEDWSTGDNNFCYLVVPLFLYLLYDRKERFRFDQFSWFAPSQWSPLCSTRKS